MEFVLEKYHVAIPEEESNIRNCCKKLSVAINKKYQEEIQEEWSRNMHYGKVVLQEENKIMFPAYSFPSMDTWRRGMLLTAAEEQLHGMGALPHRRNCRRGCNKVETAYHVSTACVNNAYVTRHDNVVHWTLKTLFKSLRAP